MIDNGETRLRRPGWFYRITMAFIGLFDRFLHLSCRSFTRLASKKVERPLSRWEYISYTVHRVMCRICRIQERRMAQLRRLVHAVEVDTSERPGVWLSDQAADRLRRVFKEAVGDL